MSNRALIAIALALFVLALIADYAFGEMRPVAYLSIVQNAKAEPTIAAGPTATPWVSVGGPYVPPTLTPTVTPEPMVKP